jgi:galactose oxidase
MRYLLRLILFVFFSTASLNLPALAKSGTPQWVNQPTLGEWSTESPWPTVGVHLAVLADGRVVTWGEDIPTPGTTAFPTYVVTIPRGSTDTSAVQKLVINDDLFCAGESFLGDGRLFVAGGSDQPAPTNGSGRATTDIFDPVSSTWSSGPTMSVRRWYPTVTTMPTGEVLALLGSIDMNFTTAETPDLTINGGTAFRSFTGVSTANVFYNYPRAFVAPNGKIFLAGMEQASRYLSLARKGSYSMVASSNFSPLRVYGSAVMYDVGKILIVGGGTSDSAATTTNTAEVINLRAPRPAWRYVGPMAFARRYLNATLMADGKVLITGGSSGPAVEDCTTAVLPTEIWDPATEKFTTVASMPHYRVYHSTAVLLPDGRVLSAGTTASDSGCSDQQDADFYSPPYLFNGPRPTITSAPSALSYRHAFSVVTPDAAGITNVNLIAFGAVTHHFNFSQRINRLGFHKTKTGLNVIAPANSNLAPPGKYMLFILNSMGVPSVASVAQLGSLH